MILPPCPWETEPSLGAVGVAPGLGAHAARGGPAPPCAVFLPAWERHGEEQLHRACALLFYFCFCFLKKATRFAMKREHSFQEQLVLTELGRNKQSMN